MSRKILDCRAREIIIMVDDYFEKEKRQSKALLQRVTQSLKEASETSKDIVISKETAMEILQHLQNTTRVTQRVMSATGVAKNTVARIRYEKEVAIATGTEIKTPVKKKRGKIEFLDKFALVALRNIVNAMYADSEEIPTMRQILATARQELNYKGSETTLRKIIKNTLGFQRSQK